MFQFIYYAPEFCLAEDSYKTVLINKAKIKSLKTNATVEVYNMRKTKSFKLVISGLLLCIGMLLPYFSAHAFGISGNVFLPMHIPVLLCGFLCGPLMGGVCGAVLPILNSVLTGMPVFYPTAILMTAELLCYGLISGLGCKLLKKGNKLVNIYISLIIAMVVGRVASGAAASLLILFNTGLVKYSVIASLITGIPGIIIQLVLIPFLIMIIEKNLLPVTTVENKAVKLIKGDTANCIIVKDNQICAQGNSAGISFLLQMHKENKLENTFVADSVVGKAAAMVMSFSGVKKCYAEIISVPAYKWFKKCNIKVAYGQKVPQIINRDKTGFCPMETAVMDIFDHKEAYQILIEKTKK